MPGSQQHSLFQMLDILIYIFYKKKKREKNSLSWNILVLLLTSC